VYEWEDRRIFRVSIGSHNQEDDLERLISALDHLL
jgi:hypothetical protein